MHKWKLIGVLSNVFPPATSWACPDWPSPTCLLCSAPCASGVDTLISSPCPPTPRPRWQPCLSSWPSNSSSKLSLPTVTARGSGSHWRRKALKQGRVLGTMKQVSLWDTAAVVTENQWKSSRKWYRTLVKQSYKYAAREELPGELLEDVDAEDKRTIKPDSRVLSCWYKMVKDRWSGLQRAMKNLQFVHDDSLTELSANADSVDLHKSSSFCDVYSC